MARGTRARTKWRGKEVRDKVFRASARGIDSIMADCVSEAKAKVKVVTATLQGGIQMRPAKIIGSKVVGIWGVWNVAYALPVEVGTGPHIIVPRTKQALYWPGAEHPVKRVRHPGTKPSPYLRPAADRFYPRLTSRIRRFMS